MFIATLFTIAKIWKQPMFIDRQMDNEDVVYIRNGILLRCKKNLAIYDNMDGSQRVLC